MTRSIRRVSMRSALLGSALALPLLSATVATAQDTAVSEDACVQLEGFSGQIDYAVVDIAEDDIIAVIEAGDSVECATFLREVQLASGVEAEVVVKTEQARIRLEDEVVIEGRVIVDQQPPSVQVEEQAAEVSVNSASPDVTVNEGPLDIMVRQAAPTINFEMPQPTITIDQPAPEIIVTMPDPSVEVANARPRIEVRQAEPLVSVTMSEAAVELELYRAEDGESSQGIAIQQGRSNADGTAAVAVDPEVAITRADAQINYLDSEESGETGNVSVNRTQPNIRFEQSEPQIEVTASPEPRVVWTQSGEPVITFNEAAGDVKAETEANAAMSDAEQPSMVNEEAATSADPAMTNTRPNVSREGFQPVDLANMTAADLEGATLYGVEGENIGEIGDLVIADGNAQEVIADVGGFLGMGERQVRVSMSDITLLQSEDGGQLRAYINATEDQLMTYPEVE